MRAYEKRAELEQYLKEIDHSIDSLHERLERVDMGCVKLPRRIRKRPLEETTD
ncbi:hypothetical protein [Roseisalinus antarcticus]|uniref:Uncharacterized protein n=1 Tax=Roseisalinus antarcticus TaxID=254357 RepID=A0A1Y5SIN2_9RHOB|nr:hypothetical protein [Roseisalinus antarcticus]SLN40026.1 hypothetical protein ROA7023_01545 [Roseisalinus antarcticus]